jgi:hypothetical protein
MITLSLLVCHRVTAQTSIPASRAFLLLIFLLINESPLRFLRLFAAIPFGPISAFQDFSPPNLDLYRAMSSYLDQNSFSCFRFPLSRFPLFRSVL